MPTVPFWYTAYTIVLSTATVYIFLLVALRLTGRRQLGHLTSFDLVIMLLLANAVQNAMVLGDNTLVGGLISAATLIGLNWLFGWLRYWFPVLAHWIGDEPLLLIADGQLVERTMRREHITLEELMSALHEHNLEAIQEVHRAYLEVDGSITVLPQAPYRYRRNRRHRAKHPRPE